MQVTWVQSCPQLPVPEADPQPLPQNSGFSMPGRGGLYDRRGGKLAEGLG